MPNKSVEPTPMSFVIRLFLGSLFILSLSILLFAKRGSSPQTLGPQQKEGKNDEAKDGRPNYSGV